jgi:hypothetical protein
VCDYPAFYTQSWPVARKPHRCAVCHLRIPIGVAHYAISGKWDEKVETYRMHRDCHAAYGSISIVVTDDCVAFHETRDSIEECSRGRRRADLDSDLRDARRSLAASLREFRKAA